MRNEVRNCVLFGGEHERKSGFDSMISRLLLACAFLLTCSAIGSADTLFTTAGAGTIRTGDGFSFDSQFTYNGASTSMVTDLGIFDVAGETWDHSHEIGLWDLTASNTQIADATVDNAGILIGGFRYSHLLVPVPLTAGHQYELAAYYFSTASSSDHLLDCCTGTPNPTPDPLFGSFSAEFTSSNTVGHLSEPNVNAGFTSYIGPNFIFQTVPATVPEPGTLVLFGSGLVSVVGFARRTIVTRS